MKKLTSALTAVFLGMSAPALALELDYICDFHKESSGLIAESTTFIFDNDLEHVVISNEIIRYARKRPIKVKVSIRRNGEYQAQWQLDLPVSMEGIGQQGKWSAKYRIIYEARIAANFGKAKMNARLKKGGFRTQSSGECRSKN
ncbi:hypothetical protein AB1A64_05405 [Ruegeria sp. ANG10]|uniref:hypothetical protein n=1 Tax=Ruegeria sp. ANG10 TaxID=3042467 RepID=UPI003453D4C2